MGSMPEISYGDTAAAGTGVSLVSEHMFPMELGEVLTVKCTLQIRTPVGTFNREFLFTGSDLLAIAQQIMDALGNTAQSYHVPAGAGADSETKAKVANWIAANGGYAVSYSE